MIASGPVALSSRQRITVVVVDDHELVRELLTTALNQVSDITVVAQAVDAETAIDLCRLHRPSVVLLDAFLPGQQGPEAIAAIRQGSPLSRVLLFSGTTSPVSIRRAFAAGGRGFFAKSAPLHELIEGVRTVHAGQFYSGSGTRRLVQRILQDLTGGNTRSLLSSRERDVLAGIARGQGSKAIAAQLGLSVFTIENHRRRMMERTGVDSIAGLTLLALELGLAPSPHIRASDGEIVPTLIAAAS
jgi:DNA-binding NarL/FixJ family response regulator